MDELNDDELASAYLDGEVTSDERARVESDPSLLARVERLGVARDRLVAAAAEPPDASAKEAAIRTATASAPAVVIDLRRERVRRAVRVASIAAVILLVVGAAGLLIRMASDSSSSTKTSTAAAGSAPPASPESAGGVTGGDQAILTTGSLGTFDDDAALADAARAALGNLSTRKQAESAPTTTSAGTFDNAAQDQAAPAAGAAAPCPVARPDAVNQLLSTTAVLDGQVVQVDVVTLGDNSVVLVVRDPSTCREIFSMTLAN